MSTDDEIRDAFHARLDPALSNLTVSPSLLSEVRRRHAHQRRLVAVGAPLGIAVMTAGSVTAAIAIPRQGNAQTIKVQAAAGGPTATLLGHSLQFPDGWTVKNDNGLTGVEGAITSSDDANTVDESKAESILVTTPEDQPAVTITVIRDGIGNAIPVGTSSPDPSNPPATYSGDDDGDGSVDCATAGSEANHADPAHRVKLHGSVERVSPTPTSTGNEVAGTASCGTLTEAPAGPELDYTFANGDELWAEADGMSKAELTDFIHEAIGE
jgi:hypothetical protein